MADSELHGPSGFAFAGLQQYYLHCLDVELWTSEDYYFVRFLFQNSGTQIFWEFNWGVVFCYLAESCKFIEENMHFYYRNF